MRGSHLECTLDTGQPVHRSEEREVLRAEHLAHPAPVPLEAPLFSLSSSLGS